MADLIATTYNISILALSILFYFFQINQSIQLFHYTTHVIHVTIDIILNVLFISLHQKLTNHLIPSINLLLLFYTMNLACLISTAYSINIPNLIKIVNMIFNLLDSILFLILFKLFNSLKIPLFLTTFNEFIYFICSKCFYYKNYTKYSTILLVNLLMFKFHSICSFILIHSNINFSMSNYYYSNYSYYVTLLILSISTIIFISIFIYFQKQCYSNFIHFFTLIYYLLTFTIFINFPLSYG